MRGSPQVYLDYSGGLNTLAAPYQLAETQARSCLNVHTSPTTGAIKKRNGFVTHATTTLQSIHSLFPAVVTPQSLIAVGSTGVSDTILKVDLAGGNTTLKTGLTNSRRWYWAQGQTAGSAHGPIYGMNGYDAPLQWNGLDSTTNEWTADSGKVPRGKFLTFHGSRFWCAGDASTHLSRLFYSGITGTTTDPRNWDANNYVDFEPDDGQPITGIGTMGEYLVVFKARKIYLIYDLVTGANRQLTSEIGCIAPRSIIEAPEGLIFLSEDQGVMITDGSTTTSLSTTIDPTLKRASDSPGTLPDACATYKDQRYYLSLCLDANNNDHTLEYDFTTQSWWLHDCSSNEFALIDPAGVPVLYSANTGSTISGGVPVTTFGGTGIYGGDGYFGGEGAGGIGTAKVDKAFVPDVYSDNSTRYVGGTYWIGPYYVWGSPHIQKRLRQIRVDGIGEWDTYTAVDFHDIFELRDGEVWDSSSDSGGTFGGDGEYGGVGTFAPPNIPLKYRRLYTPGVGRAWSIKYVNDDTEDFQIFATTLATTARTD